MSQQDLESRMRELIYTDSDLVITPIIDNPKVRKDPKDTLTLWGWNLGDVFIPQSYLLPRFLWLSAFLSFLPRAHTYLDE